MPPSTRKATTMSRNDELIKKVASMIELRDPGPGLAAAIISTVGEACARHIEFCPACHMEIGLPAESPCYDCANEGAAPPDGYPTMADSIRRFTGASEKGGA